MKIKFIDPTFSVVFQDGIAFNTECSELSRLSGLNFMGQLLVLGQIASGSCSGGHIFVVRQESLISQGLILLHEILHIFLPASKVEKYFGFKKTIKKCNARKVRRL